MSSFDPTYHPYPPRRPRSVSALPWLVILLLALIVAGVFYLGVWPRWHAGLDPNAVPRAVTARGDLAADEKATIELYEQASPSVVHITTLAVQRNTLDLQGVPEGTGSGFVWDDDGRIVTNYHVIRSVAENGSAAQVTLSDNSTWPARLLGAYPDMDLAVLVIDVPQKRLSPIPIGTSHDLKVGQKTFAIGNPFGLDFSLTTGIVSALGREIESANNRSIKGVIQTDAAINPGNSGGPLLDSAGRLIGVNTAIISPSRASAGIGFAIPVDEVNRVVPQLIAHGKVVRPGLGVVPAEDQIMERLGKEGVLVLSVKPDSPAARASLRPTRRDRSGHILLGDIIIAIDGKPIKVVRDLYSTLDQYKVGDTITATIVRDGESQDVQVTLEAVA